MIRQVCFLPEHITALNELTELAKSERELFRLNAAKAYLAFPATDRAIIKKLTADSTTGYALLNQWQSSLQPLAAELSASGTRPAFARDIAKYLFLDMPSAERRVEDLLATRRQEAREKVLYELYPLPINSRKDRRAAPRNNARNLLMKTAAEIESLKERYVAYLLHQTVALTCAIPVEDAHTPWLKRILTRRRIASERKKLNGVERKRLHDIAQRLNQLNASHDGMLGELLRKEWDLIVVISLRNKYEKQIQALPPTERLSPLKRLTIFEKITKQFRDEQIDKLAHSNPAHDSLVAVRHYAETTDALLLRIFDLSNEQKNQLLVLSKEARDLQKEREALMSGQVRRQQLLRKNS